MHKPWTRRRCRPEMSVRQLIRAEVVSCILDDRRQWASPEPEFQRTAARSSSPKPSTCLLPTCQHVYSKWQKNKLGQPMQVTRHQTISRCGLSCGQLGYSSSHPIPILSSNPWAGMRGDNITGTAHWTWTDKQWPLTFYAVPYVLLVTTLHLNQAWDWHQSILVGLRYTAATADRLNISQRKQQQRCDAGRVVGRWYSDSWA